MIELFVTTLGAYIILYALLYFVPCFVALSRCHNNKVPIIILTLFLGWTFLGWVIALVWSFTDNVNKEELAETDGLFFVKEEVAVKKKSNWWERPEMAEYQEPVLLKEEWRV